MKITVTLFFLVITLIEATAQWTGPDASNNLYHLNGNVGIGTVPGDSRLHIANGELGRANSPESGNRYSKVCPG